jgi:hypothetical protein
VEAWDRVPGHLEQARAYAAEAGLVALPAHLDRLEGRMLLASGDRDGAIERWDAALATFDAIQAAWEHACTALLLADALGAADRARELVAGAREVLERAGSQREIAAAERLEGRLS